MACRDCGMEGADAPRYHPYAACLLYKLYPRVYHTEAEIRAVVEYGWKAAKAGVSVDEAMRDVLWMNNTEGEDA